MLKPKESYTQSNLKSINTIFFPGNINITKATDTLNAYKVTLFF